MKLYEIEMSIEQTIARMFELVDEETGEVDSEALAELEALNIARETKLENIACYIKNLEADVLALKREEDTLARRRKVTENEIERLKNFLINHISPEEKFNFSRAVISFRKSEKVEILDEDIIPERYKTEEITYKVSKNDIKADLKAGIEVAGAELVENHNLQIK